MRSDIYILTQITELSTGLRRKDTIKVNVGKYFLPCAPVNLSGCLCELKTDQKNCHIY